jgi:hypothetical protein
LRAVSSDFNHLHLIGARVGSVIQIDWPSLNLGRDTVQEFVHEFIDVAMLLFRQAR